jgi:hypothetical protein
MIVAKHMIFLLNATNYVFYQRIWIVISQVFLKIQIKETS